MSKRRAIPSLLLVAALLMKAVAGVTLAKTFTCTPGSTAQAPCQGTKRVDKITGTTSADYILAKKGRDFVSAEAGNDVVFGGRGNEKLLFGGLGTTNCTARTATTPSLGGLATTESMGDPETTASQMRTVQTRMSSLTAPAMTPSTFLTETATTRCAAKMARH